MLKQVLQVLDVLDDPLASGEAVAALFRSVDSGMHVEVQRVAGDRGFTEFVKVRFPGSAGKIKGGIIAYSRDYRAFRGYWGPSP